MADQNDRMQELSVLENRQTVVSQRDVRVTKYLPSAGFDGFSREHAAALAFGVADGQAFTVVPVQVQRWAREAPDAPSDPQKAWALFRRRFLNGEFE